ncbi:hypothetical protein [Saccharothrix hoggarensis]|uniref:ABC-2 family transporter n=1 Tax=Saccharothrix hoggarensis TaxID=913853 RepID=A0ABW3QZF7_9PSEU
MTATTTTPVTTAAPARARTHVGWADLLWLTWRQHRWTVVGTAVAVGGVIALALGMAWHVDATGTADHRVLGEWRYLGLSQFLVNVPVLLGGLFASFWAAPLLSREYEQRTHLVVWSQDVTPIRWLTGKVVLLGAAAVALAAGLSTALVKMMNSVNAVRNEYVPFQPFGNAEFEAVPQVQVAYAAFGFALGLALSAVTRRTVPAMGLALVGFYLVRGIVAAVWRPYFQTPLRSLEPYHVGSLSWVGDTDGRWRVESGYADAAGNEVRFTGECSDVRSDADIEQCMRDHGIVHWYTDYHPAERLLPFQLFETGIFLVLAAGLLALAFVWVRRARRV